MRVQQLVFSKTVRDSEGHQVRADLSAADKPARCNIVEFRFNV